jgi:protein phosphatase
VNQGPLSGEARAGAAHGHPHDGRPSGGSPALVRVSVFGKTDLGQTRDHNEDTFLVADLTRGQASLQPEVREHDVGSLGSLFMVADGMGGAAAGEFASDMAVRKIHEFMELHWTAESEPTSQRFATRLKEAVEHANAQLYAYAVANPEVRGMGTTVTAAGVLGAELYLTQIGDSRAYLVRNGSAIQLTKDQSLMQRLVDAGELTEEVAERSERRNIILQALGPDPRVKVDLTFQQVRRGDLLLICSDGLSGLVRKEEIGEVAAAHSDLPALCSALIDLANSRGGPDNITVVAARFDGEGLPAPGDGDGDAVGYRQYPLADTEATTAEHPIETEAPAPPARRASPLARPVTFAAFLVLLALLGLFLVLR